MAVAAYNNICFRALGLDTGSNLVLFQVGGLGQLCSIEGSWRQCEITTQDCTFPGGESLSRDVQGVQ